MENNTMAFLQQLSTHHQQGWQRGTHTHATIEWINDLLEILFPKTARTLPDMEKSWQTNQQHLRLLLSSFPSSPSNDNDSADDVGLFYDAIPTIYAHLQTDATAIFNSDPAARSIGEVLNAYPGFLAIAVYRIAHQLHQQNVQSIPRILTEYAHSKTGIDIHPGAAIDVPFIIDHGTGIVIGETAVIGRNVQIYQGVTLGALWVEKQMELKKRHPTVEHNVVIYANATILGGSTVIGNNSIIGGNTFITKSVNPYSMVQQSSRNAIIDMEEQQAHLFFTI